MTTTAIAGIVSAHSEKLFMQFVPFEDGIEVNGQTLRSVVEGFAIFKKVPSDILLGLGLGHVGPDGLVQIGPGEWVSQARWLLGFRAIEQAAGTSALYGIGLKIPEFAIFPPWVSDIHSAIRSIDIAYHLNHRKAGRVMFDSETNIMTDGIGHYGYAPVPNERRILAACSNPYPCDFDRGILTAMARRFAADARLEHLEPDACRRNGGDTCTYAITWTS